MESLIENALEANLSFQSKMNKELIDIAHKKRVNRRLSRSIVSYLAYIDTGCWQSHNDNITSSVNKMSNFEKKGKNRKRKWHLRFFLDTRYGLVSSPIPNDDTIRRRKWRGNLPYLRYNSVWSTSEKKKLSRCTEKLRYNSEICHDSDQITVLLPDKSFRECVRKYRCQNISEPIKEFSRFEMLKILRCVHQNPNKYTSWEHISQSCMNRTPFQCFRQYHTHMNISSRNKKWNLYHDEFLLKFVAAVGPQYVMDSRAASDLSIKFLPHFDVTQILTRAHRSLVNPNLYCCRWSQNEERKLVLSMKVYSENRNDIGKARNHFPHRSAKMVSEKWVRSLNPVYVTQPFTPYEDEMLLSLVKIHGVDNWGDISGKMWHRDPRKLLHRWMVIADSKDVLKAMGERYFRKYAGRKCLVSRPEYKEEGKSEAMFLSPEDFLIINKRK